MVLIFSMRDGGRWYWEDEADLLKVWYFWVASSWAILYLLSNSHILEEVAPLMEDLLPLSIIIFYSIGN